MRKTEEAVGWGRRLLRRVRGCRVARDVQSLPGSVSSSASDALSARSGAEAPAAAAGPGTREENMAAAAA